MGAKESTASSSSSEPIGRPFSSRKLGEPSNRSLCNDLKVAIDLNVGQGWCALYPADSLGFEASAGETVAVRLRDDHHIQGQWQVVGSVTKAKLSAVCGPFLSEATRWYEEEERSATRELQRHTERLEALAEMQSSIYQREKRRAVRRLAIFFVVQVSLLTVFAIVEPEDELASVLLSSGAAVIFATCCLCQILNVVRCRNYSAEAEGTLLLEDQQLVRNPSRNPLFNVLQLFVGMFVVIAKFINCIRVFCASVFCLLLACGWLSFVVLHMSTLHSTKGFWLTPWILLSSILASLFCSCFLWLIHVRFYSVHEARRRNWKQIEQRACEHTIVFEGRVLPGRGEPCVCSWPGKYESAWDALVQKSRGREVSAAVVFLPEGTQRFGKHDRIPRKHKLPGKCWCFPLYGEKKPWGCRWWTLWIANIEKAVREGAELQVYYFEAMKGQGHVQDFNTAGNEHLRREALNGLQRTFESLPEYAEVLSAANRLSNAKNSAGSSQCSREKRRLFLEWLPPEDRDFLQASEGLGNSQKAEVAWLEMQGYPYTKVEVDVDTWLSGSNPFIANDQIMISL